MHVLEEQHQRVARGEVPEEGAHGMEDQPLQRLALDALQALGVRAGGAQPHQGGDERHDLLGLGAGDLAYRLVEPHEGLGILGAAGDSGPAAQQVGEGMEAQALADRQRPADQQPGALRLLGGKHLGHQPRLADAGLADQADDGALPTHQPRQALAQEPQLGLAPDQRRAHGRARIGRKVGLSIAVLNLHGIVPSCL